MTKEVDIIKKAMADNKKVFLKEMKQLYQTHRFYRKSVWTAIKQYRQVQEIF